MSEREAFERRIIEQPDDDTVRLVFADWLDEQGRPDDRHRAETIRGQIHLARTGEWTPGACVRVDEEMRWEPILWEMRLYQRARCIWSRGFVSHIELPCDTFLKHAKALFSLHPITSVRLSDKEPNEIGASRLRYWYRTEEEDRVAAALHFLPEEIHRRLKRGTRDPGLARVLTEETSAQWMVYPTDTDALADLSGACVAFGRSLVRPELPSWEPNLAPVRGA